MIVLGLMSGTSMDGLDCCLADININRNYDIHYKILSTSTFPYKKSLKNQIIDSIDENKDYKNLDINLGKVFKDISKEFLGKSKIDLIASHGQTVKHIDRKLSIQLGHPKFLSKEFNVPVLYDFRNNDISAGGNGAPLVPFLDWILFRKNRYNTIALNIGGISNLSFIKSDSKLNETIGFDCGAGMCLVDKYVYSYWGLNFDDSGSLSSKGIICNDLLKHLLNEDKFIFKIPPKSTTIETYTNKIFNEIIIKFNQINKYDFLRTLVNFTAISISKNIRMFLMNKYMLNTRCIISGGGAKNNVLLSDLRENLKEINIDHLDFNGLNVDNKESFLMAVLGLTSFLNIPNNIPNVTGASKNIICGKIYES